MAKILKVRVVGYKCFRDTATTIEPCGVTSLTGANDSGKSSFITAINLFFSPTQSILADEVCTYITDSERPYVEMEFECQRDGELRGFTNVEVGQRFSLRRLLPTGPANQKYMMLLDNKWTDIESFNVSTMFPQILTLTPEVFASRYPRSSPPTTTGQLLARRFGFGNPMGAIQQHTHELSAKPIVSEWIEQNWKANVKKEFDFVHPEGDITYIMREEMGEFRPMHLFGLGFQRYVTLIIRIEEFRQKPGEELVERLVLIDEPENSLHPRAQRHLLSYLKTLGDSTQVIYSTHSPCMIDQSEPKSVRVFVRDINKKNTQVFSKKAIHDNFELVRTALGVMPSDSLFFGRLNLVVEGAIELLCFPSIVRLLEQPGFANVDLAQIALINGSGQEVPRMFRLALATNQPTVALVDDDAAGRRFEKRIRQDLSEARAVLDYDPILKWTVGDAENETEFEDLLPRGKYVAAVNRLCKPRVPLEERMLENLVGLTRTAAIKKILQEQGLHFDDFKTDVALDVVKEMDASEAEPFREVFRKLAEIQEHCTCIPTQDFALGNIESD